MRKKPRIFVVGDSISLHYEPHLQESLGEGFEYDRLTGQEEVLKALANSEVYKSGDSSSVLAYLEVMAEDAAFYPDLLILNCGLHDIKVNPQSGEKQVSLSEYRQNLSEIVDLLANRNIRLVWVRTTPVDDDLHNSRSRGFYRYAADVKDYNAVADSVMTSAGVSTIDLHGFTRSLGENVFLDHVHFVDSVRAAQGKHIAAFVGDFFGGNQPVAQ